MDKLEALHHHRVYELVDRPIGHNIIKNQWVFDVTIDSHKKAMPVANSSSQQEGIDFEDIFSPIVHFETVSSLL